MSHAKEVPLVGELIPIYVWVEDALNNQEGMLEKCDVVLCSHIREQPTSREVFVFVNQTKLVWFRVK